MKKKFLIVGFFATLVVATIFITSCKKDEFTEKDALNLKAQIDRTRDSLLAIGGVIVYTVNVMDAGAAGFTSGRISGESVLSGATVTVTQGNSTSTATTNAAGQVVFNDMRIGNVSVVVAMNGYATVSYIADLTPADEGTPQSVRNAATQVPMFPTTGNNTATISGIVSYESNLTNLTKEYPQGATVVAAIDVNDPAFHAMYIDPTGGAGTQNTNQAGRIIKMAFASASSTGTVDANGNYSITIPATASGLPIKLEVSQVVANQSIILATVNGQDVNGVQSIRTIFDYKATSASTIPTISGGTISSAYAVVSAPTATNIGLPEANATAFASINSGAISGITVVSQGLNYPSKPYVFIDGDGQGAAGDVVLSNGKVVSAFVTAPGSNYTWANVYIVAFSHVETAKVKVNVSNEGFVTGFTVTNPGKGYVSTPTITIYPTVSSMGAGAIAECKLNMTNGTLGTVRLINGGSDYKGDNYPTAKLPSITGGSASFNVFSGANQIRDIDLGTGIRQILN